MCFTLKDQVKSRNKETKHGICKNNKTGVKDCYCSNTGVNRWILSCSLKVSKEVTDVKFSRREFQSLGATSVKAKSFLFLSQE